MKIRLEFEFEEIDKETKEDKSTKEKIIDNLEEKEPTKKEMKEALTQSLFETCEDWVLRGQEPDLEFID